MMKIVNRIEDLRAVRGTMTGSVGLVPTMGYLHAGHLSLIANARADCEHVIVSIFVNPTQFAPDEDLATYPRDHERDLALLEQAEVDVVFMPTAELLYPPDFQTWVTVTEVTQGREGAQRPTHFRGVTTIVNKLFNVTQADRAYFGQKDAQQVVVIRRMVYDLNVPIEIIVCPIVRETDGLARSSRNVYLSEQDRQAALVLHQTLQAVGARYDAGERDPQRLRQLARELIFGTPRAKLDYVSVANAHTLEEVYQPSERPLLLSLAAQVGKPRLLDNCLLPLALNTRAHLSAVLGVPETGVIQS